MRHGNSADALLLDYVEARERLASAPALQMTLTSGMVGSALCSKPHCAGSPRLDEEGDMRCTVCRRFWDVELIQVGKTEIGGKVSMWGRRRSITRTRVAARESESRSHRTVRGLAFTMDQLFAEHPHATRAWTLHVLDDQEVLAGRANCLGMPLDHIPARLSRLIEVGVLPPCDVRITLYRTRQWIGFARRRAVELVEQRTRRTLAAASDVRVLQ